jgi:hypothetical protein
MSLLVMIREVMANNDKENTDTKQTEQKNKRRRTTHTQESTLPPYSRVYFRPSFPAVCVCLLVLFIIPFGSTAFSQPLENVKFALATSMLTCLATILLLTRKDVM